MSFCVKLFHPDFTNSQRCWQMAPISAEAFYTHQLLITESNLKYQCASKESSAAGDA